MPVTSEDSGASASGGSWLVGVALMAGERLVSSAR